MIVLLLKVLVGINNNSPQNTLDVNGTLDVSGNASLGTLDVGGISSTGNITTSGILTCNELSPGMGDISSSYSANHFPSGLGIKLNFGRGFSQSIGSTWTANFYTPNYADEIMFNSYQADSSGGGPSVLSITRADKLRMAVKRADWTEGPKVSEEILKVIKITEKLYYMITIIY